MEKTETKTSGIGFVGLLQLLFLGLKLGNVGVVATWSWWWVFSPMIISFGLILLLGILVYLAS